jgi:CheY-like chemotaxis protein
MGQKQILIVDDEPHMRVFMATLFETSGYKPVLARNGNEGIEKAKESAPDLIILDVMMPGGGGVQMYRQLKKDDRLRDIPVIMLSAVEGKTFSHSLKMFRASEDGMLPEPDAYVEKLPEAEELLKIAESFLLDSNG